MIELKNVEQELGHFRGRLLAAALFVLVCFGLLAARLVYLQVVMHEDLATQAEANRIAVLPVTPIRGLILDRNGVVLATNYSAYTLEITPSLLVQSLDETIDALAELVEITPRDRRRFKRLLEDSKNFDSLPIRTKLVRRGSRTFRRPTLSICRRRRARALVPPIPAGCGRQPPAGLHRPRQSDREAGDGRVGR